jgi:hypothetical protein
MPQHEPSRAGPSGRQSAAGHAAQRAAAPADAAPHPRAVAQAQRIHRLFGARAGHVAVAQRADGDDHSGITVVRRSDHDATLQQWATDALQAELAAAGEKILGYLKHGLGVGGASLFRSSELREFRQEMKDQARQQVGQDIDQQLQANGQQGPATKAHLSVAARSQAYKPVKKSVDDQLADEAQAWMQQHWNTAALQGQLLPGVRDAAWTVLRDAPSQAATIKQAKKAAKTAAQAAVAQEAQTAQAAARDWKNRIVKPATPQDQQVSDQEQQRLGQDVAHRVSTDQVASKALDTVIKANTTDEGLGVLGRMLDQLIPQAGDSASISVELKIPIPESPAYVTLKLEGKAGRGTTGFATSGVTTLGDPKRLEVMAKFSVGVGAEAFGLKGDLSVGFFVRAGANDGTAATMKSLSYGAYRSASALSSSFGNWWSGNGKGSDLKASERAEAWAAMIEEQVFEGDDSAYADIGGSLGASGKVNGGFATLGASGSGDLFRRYDKTGLAKSLGARFAQPLAQPGKAYAEQRRQEASGRMVGSINFGLTADASIAGQKVAFAASFSAEKADSEESTFARNWGVEISAALGFSPGSMTQVEQIATGFCTAALSTVQTVGQMAQQRKVGVSVLDIGADISRAVNGGLNNQLTDALGNLWSVPGSALGTTVGTTGAISASQGLVTSSTVQAAMIFGMTGGNGVFRLELRDNKSMSINLGGGTNVGATIQADRSKRLLALGAERNGQGQMRPAVEVTGLRVG